MKQHHNNYPRNVIWLDDHRGRRGAEHEQSKRQDTAMELGERALMSELETRPRRELKVLMEDIYREGDTDDSIALANVRADLEAEGLSDIEVLEGVQQAPLASEAWREMRQNIQTYFKTGKGELAQALIDRKSQLQREGMPSEQILGELYGLISADYVRSDGGTVDLEGEQGDPLLPEVANPSTKPTLRIIK